MDQLFRTNPSAACSAQQAQHSRATLQYIRKQFTETKGAISPQLIFRVRV